MSRDDGREPAELDGLARAWTAADAADAFQAELDISKRSADPERIWRAAAGESSTEEVRALAREATTDPGVSLAWRLARELAAAEEAERAPVAAAPIDRSLSARRLWRPWPVAAALAAAVLVVVGLRLLAPLGPAPVWRDGDTIGGGGGVGGVGASATLVPEGEDGALLPRGAFVLRWREPGTHRDPSTLYTVRITTADLGLVYEDSHLESPHATVPETALAPWPAGTTFYWQVEARSPDGGRISSPAVRVVLAD